MSASEKCPKCGAGPIYGMGLLDSLPLSGGGMRQALPNEVDLRRAQRDHTRLVAGYEVLLSHYMALRAENKRLTAEAAELRAEVAATNMLLAERTARRDELVAENERLRKLRTSLLGDVAHIIGELLTWVDKSDEASDYASSCALGAIINEARSWERHFERAKRIEAAEAAPAEKEADHE